MVLSILGKYFVIFVNINNKNSIENKQNNSFCTRVYDGDEVYVKYLEIISEKTLQENWWIFVVCLGVYKHVCVCV